MSGSTGRGRPGRRAQGRGTGTARWARTAALAGVTACAVLLAGCGSDGKSGDKKTGADNALVGAESGAEAGKGASGGDTSGGAEGSRENPVPLGTAAAAGDWEITLDTFTGDATDEVLAANSFNEPPADGNHYALATFTVTYTGDGSATTSDLSFAYVTADGNVIKTYDNDAVTPDPELDGELYGGASLTGNVDFEIPADGSGLVRVTVGFDDEVFFATS